MDLCDNVFCAEEIEECGQVAMEAANSAVPHVPMIGAVKMMRSLNRRPHIMGQHGRSAPRALMADVFDAGGKAAAFYNGGLNVIVNHGVGECPALSNPHFQYVEARRP